MKIDTNPSVVDFFRTTVRSILSDKKVHVQESTEFYVVNLLTRAVQSSNETSDPNYFTKPLAILFGEAFSSDNIRDRYLILQHLGDQALYVSGFFGDSLARKIIDIDYYIAMGSQAYDHLSEISKRKKEKDHFSMTFDELSRKFSEFVDLFSQISERASITNNQDVVRIYERWLCTKSERLLKQLQQLGIHPVKPDREGLH